MHGAASGRPSPWVERIFVKDSTHTHIPKRDTKEYNRPRIVFCSNIIFRSQSPLLPAGSHRLAWLPFGTRATNQPASRSLAYPRVPAIHRHSLPVCSSARWQLTQLETKLIVKPHRARIGCTATALCTQCTHKHTHAQKHNAQQ